MTSAPAPTPHADTGRGPGTASLVIGIVAWAVNLVVVAGIFAVSPWLLFFWYPYFPVPTLVVVIVGLVLGIVAVRGSARATGRASGRGIAGIVLNGLGTVASLLLVGLLFQALLGI